MQLELPLGEDGLQDVQTPTRLPGVRSYWEHRGEGVGGWWEEVAVRVRYGRGPRPGEAGPVLPWVVTGPAAPRNVLVERADGTAAVRPVRLLRTRRPARKLVA